jgi:hypothetical protein
METPAGRYSYSYQSKEMFVGREELGADVLFELASVRPHGAGYQPKKLNYFEIIFSLS